MVCWDMLWEFSGRRCQYHMKTLKENKVGNPVGLWDEAATQCWEKSNQTQLFFQECSEAHHLISK
eukprot:7339424-Prorocentrum_lima.AAC.1